MTICIETRKTTIREAFRAGQLRVLAVDPTSGTTSLCKISDVMRHNTSHKSMTRTTVQDGRFVDTTVDHSLFFRSGDGVTPVQAEEIRVGDVIASVDGVLEDAVVANVERLPAQEHTYDLSVPGPENFVLANGILAHNSYSIGGVSLEIEKASKYESLYQTLKDQFDSQLDKAKATVKFVRGLQQPKFGIGIRSSFGPYVGGGVLSPRQFVGF